MDSDFRRASRFLLYGVRGESMSPTLRPGDYLLVRTAATSTRKPARSDIVVIAAPEQAEDELSAQPEGDMPAQPEGEILKRIVGLPGERVVFADGMLFIDGQRLTEPYLRGLPSQVGLDESEFALGEDEYFIMGDNRAHSTDSRHYGPVRRARIEGRALARIFPPLRWGGL